MKAGARSYVAQNIDLEEKMKQETREKLKAALKICEVEDKSIEYTIQFLQDCTGASHDCVMKFLKTDGGFREVR